MKGLPIQIPATIFPASTPRHPPDHPGSLLILKVKSTGTHAAKLRGLKQGVGEDDVQMNVENIARFNALLDAVKVIEQSGKFDTVSKNRPAKIQFEFVSRNEPVNRTKHESAEMNTNKRPTTEHNPVLRVKMDFDPPSSKPDEVYLNYFYRFLAKLFYESGIPITPYTQSSWQRERTAKKESRSRASGILWPQVKLPRAMEELFSVEHVDNDTRRALGWELKRKPSKRRIIFKSPLSKKSKGES